MTLYSKNTKFKPNDAKNTEILIFSSRFPYHCILNINGALIYSGKFQCNNKHAKNAATFCGQFFFKIFEKCNSRKYDSENFI